MNHNRLIRWSGLIVLSALLSTAPPAQAAASSALAQKIVHFYAWYAGEVIRGETPTSQHTTMRRYVSRRLAKWLVSAAYRDYDADYFLQAQDNDKDWDQAAVTDLHITNRTATALVTLGHPKPANKGIGVRKLRLKLLKEAGAWKIDRVTAL